MKYAIVVLMLVGSLRTAAQETRLVTNKFEKSNQAEEEYSVLKSDETIRHGPYLKYFPVSEEDLKQLNKINSTFAHVIAVKGNYINSKREGEWIFYSSPGVIEKQGMFTNDKETGIWTTTREGGDVTERYDYDRNIKLPPRISLHVRYPAAAKKAKIEGVVSVSYQVHPDCSITDLAITQSLSPECDSMMLKAMTDYSALYQKYSFDCEEETLTKDFRFSLK